MEEKKESRDEELIEKLVHNVAGEPINYRSYERFNVGALPKTLSTLMKAKKTEAYISELKGSLTPGMRLAVLVMGVMGIIAIVILMIMRQYGVL